MPLDLRMRGEHDRRRLALDCRLDSSLDPAQQFEKLRFAHIFRGFGRLRLCHRGRRPALWATGRAGLEALLKYRLVVDFLDALRQLDAGEFVEAPARALVEPGAPGADRQHPEAAGRVDHRQQWPDAEMRADEKPLGAIDRQLVHPMETGGQKHAEPAGLISPELFVVYEPAGEIGRAAGR